MEEEGKMMMKELSNEFPLMERRDSL